MSAPRLSRAATAYRSLPTPSTSARPGRVVLAEVARGLGVSLVGLGRGRRELGRERAVAVRGDQCVMGSRAALGGHGGLDRLPARGGQALGEPGVQAGAPAGEHGRDGGQARRDVPPGVLAVARQQLHAVPDRADQADRGAQLPQRLLHLMPGQLRLEPLPQEPGGQPVGVRGDGHRLERGQRRGDEVGPGGHAVRAVIGARAEGGR